MTRIEIVAALSAAALLLIVLELVRRRRLLERYALLWLLSAVVLVGLAIWKGLLADISQALGIANPPNALFLIAFGFVLLLLLHFSLAISRLADETKVLAQRLALTDQKLRTLTVSQNGEVEGAAGPDQRPPARLAGSEGP